VAPVRKWRSRSLQFNPAYASHPPLRLQCAFSKVKAFGMEQDVTPEASYISETLYHFLPDSFGIFTSIVNNGLLCSVGNKGKLDRFAVTLEGEGVRQFDIWQHPRVCFTDIPREHLGAHVKRYGKFGLGFARETTRQSGILIITQARMGLQMEVMQYYINCCAFLTSLII
jgi:hypothetical protein